LGLSRGTTLAHIARAALESIAFQSAALLQAMAPDANTLAKPPDEGRECSPGSAGEGSMGLEGPNERHAQHALRELRVDGGACANDLLMQFQADLLGIAVVRPAVIETTALGAAFLAGLAVGVYASTDELSALWRAQRRFEPQISRSQAQALMQRWEHAVRQTLAP
jgi:glycerol kinase